MIDLRPNYARMVLEILEAQVPDAEVWAFGSRVAGTAQNHSDLDLAIVSETKLGPLAMVRLKLAFEESNIPFRVDVLDWHDLDEEFRKVIKNRYELLRKAKSGGN